MKFTVAGNAAFDTTLLDPHEIIDDQDPALLRIHPREGYPINIKLPGYEQGKGGKINSDHSLDEMLIGIGRYEVLGGGGPNSAKKLRQLDPEVGILSLDVSRSSDMAKRIFDSLNIDFHFFGKRPIPANIWIPQYDKEGRQNSLGVTRKTLDRFDPQPYDISTAENRMEGSDALLLNSMKDYEFAFAFAEIMKNQGRPVYMVITPSLKRDFAVVEQNFLPHSVGIVNYKELSKMLGRRTKNEEKMKQHARETMIRLGKSGDFFGTMYTTLDDGGVYARDRTGLYHIYLQDNYNEAVDNFLKAGNGMTRGAGDGFASHVMLQETKTNRELPAHEYARDASRFSIEKCIGFDGHLPDDAFVVKKLQ